VTCAALVFGAGVLPGPVLPDAAPQRVVSVNLCTDQLALMMAAPGQLISVSRLAHDRKASAMVDAALPLPTNGSTAEEVFLLNPDLVLAGTFTSAATVGLLRDLGIRVELFAPAQSMSDVPARLAQMGEALGQQTAAAAMIAGFEADLDAIAVPAGSRPRAALTYVNNYSSGDKTLAGDILRVAGFANVAAEVGLSSVGTLSLEQLVLLAPDVIIQGRDYPGQARAEDNLDHPALRALKGTVMAGEITDRDWICGTPQVMQAVRTMRNLRTSLEQAQ
jgi:iron complex transport system substrate-binding protein